MKRVLGILLLLTVLAGCGGRQQPPETTAQTGETEPWVTEETVYQETSQTAEAPPAQAPADETVPEEWISQEETPEAPTRPEQVVEEKSTPQILPPEPEDHTQDRQPDPHEDETPLAVA